MSFSIKNKDILKKSPPKKGVSSQGSEDNNSQDHLEEEFNDVIDENLVTLKKVHSILLNCINLTKKQKLGFAESERFFMKLHLKKLLDKLEDL